MPKIPLFFLILLFVLWLGYEIKKSTRASKKNSEDFWDRENEALLTPRKSTDDIHFIMIPKDLIPAPLSSVPEWAVALESDEDTDYEELLDDLNGLISELTKLSDSKIADLSAYTNTELRLKYGSPNFTELSNADTAYTRLVQLMASLIGLLKVFKMNEEARALLDFCKEEGISSSKINALND